MSSKSCISHDPAQLRAGIDNSKLWSALTICLLIDMEQLLVGSAGSDSSSGIEVSMDSHGSLHERTGEKIMPIAIVGMSCRFPGDATSPEKLWNLCAEARSTWSEVPLERFNQKAFYHPQAEKLGTVSHFLKTHRYLHVLTISSLMSRVPIF